MTDLTLLTEAEFTELYDAVAAETRRRNRIRDLETTLNAATTEALTDAGVQPGDEWRQPTGAHDAYPAGWIVTHNGTEWESLTPANVWGPGVTGWREVVTDPETPPEWVQPTGAHDAYQIGDRVTYNGAIYTSLISDNVWAPTDYPAGWQAEETP